MHAADAAAAAKAALGELPMALPSDGYGVGGASTSGEVAFIIAPQPPAAPSAMGAQESVAVSTVMPATPGEGGDGDGDGATSGVAAVSALLQEAIRMHKQQMEIVKAAAAVAHEQVQAAAVRYAAAKQEQEAAKRHLQEMEAYKNAVAAGAAKMAEAAALSADLAAKVPKRLRPPPS